MKLRYTTPNGRLTFEFDGENHKELVSQLAAFQEIFEEPACGCCKSEKIRFDVREFDGNTYYKLLCEACNATLDFGQHKTGNTLFVKRFVKDTREPLPNKGWYRYAEKPAESPKAKPAPTVNHTTKPKPAEPTPAQNLALALDTMARIRTAAGADEWAAWWKSLPDTTPAMDDQLMDAYHAAMERIAVASGPARRPAPVGVGADKDIPF